TENSRHFSSSSRAPSISSRSSILRSVFGASSSAYGGSVNAPFLRSAGALSGSGSGSVGSLAMAAGFLIGGGVGREAAAFRAVAAALTTAAVFDLEGYEGGEGYEGSSCSLAEDFATSGGRGLFVSSFVFSFVSFAAFVSFAKCFFNTSWRCFCRSFSSRRCAIAARIPAQRSDAICASTENRRPNENCVDRMIAAKSSVRIRMIEPVRFRYSARTAASRSPMKPPARNSLPPTSRWPKASDRNDETQPKSSSAPATLVYAASTARHQK